MMNISDFFNSPQQAGIFEELIKNEQSFIICGPDRSANIEVFSAILANRRYDQVRYIAALKEENYIKPALDEKQEKKILIGDCLTKESVGEMLALFSRKDPFSVSAMWIDKFGFEVFMNCLSAGCRGGTVIWDISNAREAVDKIQEWFKGQKESFSLMAWHLMFLEVESTDKGPKILNQCRLSVVNEELVISKALKSQ